jgi:ribosomal protein S27AE
MATQQKDTKIRQCPFCSVNGTFAYMMHHKPLKDHWYCSGCGHIEVDWPPIYRRVKALLYDYPFAKSRLAMVPTVGAVRYDTPYVDGGLAISQQEAHMEREARDHWLTKVVENTFKLCLTRKQRLVIVSIYFERYSYRATAEKLQIAKSTVEAWEEEALKAFARTADWA